MMRFPHFFGHRRFLWTWLFPLVGLIWISGCNLPRPTVTAAPPQVYLTTVTWVTATTARPTLSPQVMTVTPQPPNGTPASTPTENLPCNMAAAAPRVDITIPDGTVLRPGQPFTKIWRLLNVGSCTWTPDYAVVWFSGPRLGAPGVIPLGATVPPGQAVDIAVDMVAPTQPGRYTSYWKLRDPQGHLFGIGAGDGSPFWVSIVVQAERSPTPTITPSPTVTLTATPTLTPTPTLAVQAQGQVVLHPAGQSDLDTLSPDGAVPDLGYVVDEQGTHWLNPLNGALLGVYGLSAPSPEACRKANKAAVALPLEPLSVGTYLCYRTDAGQIGRLQYLGIADEALTLEALTWATTP